MKFEVLNDRRPEGSLKGTIRASYHELCDLFGEPRKGDGYKTDVEWDIEFEDGTYATIYNWKNGPAWCGEGSVNNIDVWNVGGKTIEALFRVEEVFDGEI